MSVARKTILLLAAVAALGLLAGLGLHWRASAPLPCRGCNLVLISIDTLRADHLGCYGYEPNTSPNLDRLADGAVLFEQFYSTSAWTYPAHYSIFTGRYPTRESMIIYPATKPFSPSHRTLTEVLDAAGYQAVAFAGGGFVEAALGFGRGFSRYEERADRFEHSLPGVLAWLRQLDRKQPFFLFYHAYNVHRPYRPPDYLAREFMADVPFACDGVDFADTNQANFDDCQQDPRMPEYRAALYDGEIRYVDQILAVFFDALEREGLAAKTVVVVTSDHGEELLDHDGADHVNTLYQEIIRVPLVIRVPGVAPARVAEPVSMVDLKPTLLDLLGLPASGAGEHGHSVARLLSPTAAPTDASTDAPTDALAAPTGADANANAGEPGAPASSAAREPMRIFAVTGRDDPAAEALYGGRFLRMAGLGGGQKVILSRFEAGDESVELYALARDPNEKNDRALDEKNELVVKWRRSLVERWAEKIGLEVDLHAGRVEETQVTPEARRRLEALGYLRE